MKTNRSSRTIIVIVLIAIASIMLSACSENPAKASMNFVAKAAYSSDMAASVQALQMSPRIANCNMSSHQLLINAMNAETNKETGTVDGMTIGAWLDSKMTAQTCIAK